MSRAHERDAGIERQVLDPLDRASEFLFGLIMAVTFTCTVMYLLSCVAQRGRSLAGLRRLRGMGTLDAARPVIESALPESVVAVLSPQELDESSPAWRSCPG